MDYVINGLVMGFLRSIKYLWARNVCPGSLLSSDQIRSLQDLYMAVLCHIDDDPFTSGYLRELDASARQRMSSWRLQRLQTHSLDRRTGAFFRSSFAPEGGTAPHSPSDLTGEAVFLTESGTDVLLSSVSDGRGVARFIRAHPESSASTPLSPGECFS